MKTSGIYRIRNLVNGKFYLGSAKDIKCRWNRHRYDLRRKNHHSQYLQRAWDLHGEESFVFEVVEEVSVSGLFQREAELLADLDYDLCYNVSREASGGDLISRHPNREKIVQKRKMEQRLAIDQMTPEQRQKRWSRGRGEANPNHGNSWNAEQRQKASELHLALGVPQSTIDAMIAGNRAAWKKPEYRAHMSALRTGAGNSFHGKQHSEESKKKISHSKKGQKPPNQQAVNICGEVFESMTEASRRLGIPVPTILFRIRSKTSKFEDYCLATPDDCAAETLKSS